MNHYEMHCDCESVTFVAEGEPAAKAYCHCGDCREFYSTPILAATAWHKDSLAVTGDDSFISKHKHPHKQLTKFFCVACGDTLFGTNRLGMYVVPNKQLYRALGSATDSMRPDFHLFYRQRVVDIADSLPKYLDGRSSELFAG
jgi:hypothetical protein